MSQHPSLLASDGGGYEKVGSCHPNNLGKEIFSIVLSNAIVLKNVQTGKEDCFLYRNSILESNVYLGWWWLKINVIFNDVLKWKASFLWSPHVKGEEENVLCPEFLSWYCFGAMQLRLHTWVVSWEDLVSSSFRMNEYMHVYRWTDTHESFLLQQTLLMVYHILNAVVGGNIEAECRDSVLKMVTDLNIGNA